MATIRSLFVVSLVVNLALALVWWQQRSAESSTARGESTPLLADLASAPEETPSLATPASDRAEVAADTEALATAELEQLVRELEAAGFPRKMVVSIIMGLAHHRMNIRQFMERRQELADRPYWKSQFPSAGPERALASMKQQRQLEAQLARVLGDDYLDEIPDMLAMHQARFGPIPGAKVRRLQAVEMDYQELSIELHSTSPGGRPDPDRQRLIEEEKRADLVALLTPSELFEYDLRNSPTSHRVRSELAAAELTEAEFRTIFPLYQTLDQQFQRTPLSPGQRLDPVLMEARRAAEERTLSQIELMLGAKRAADLVQARDPEARQENQLVARLGLPLSAAAEVMTIKRDLTGRAQALSRDSTLAPEQRNAQLASLSAEAERRLSSTLGQRGLSAYREYGGNWLNRLTNTPLPSR